MVRNVIGSQFVVARRPLQMLVVPRTTSQTVVGSHTCSKSLTNACVTSRSCWTCDHGFCPKFSIVTHCSQFAKNLGEIPTGSSRTGA